jgi:hypothetical protein
MGSYSNDLQKENSLLNNYKLYVHEILQFEKAKSTHVADLGFNSVYESIYFV